MSIGENTRQPDPSVANVGTETEQMMRHAAAAHRAGRLPEAIAVYNRLKTHGRMAVCGLISVYNATKMPPSPNFSRIITHRINIQGFLVLDYAHRAREMVAEMGPWLQSGEVKWKVHVDDGLEGAVDSLNRLFTGDHDGKLLVRVSEEPAG